MMLEPAIERKTGGDSRASQVVTATDRDAEALILGALAPTIDQYDLGVLTEQNAVSGG